MSPRAYNLGLRLAATEQTRLRIIEAAREILSDEEFDGLSIDAIARRAGVARMTVYYQYTSRRGLLEALYDDLAARGLVDNLATVEEEQDPVRALDGLIEVFTRFWAGDRIIIRRLRGLAVIDQEIEAGIRRRDGWRLQRFGDLLNQIEKEQGWRPPISVEEATRLLFCLSGFEAYDAIATTEGDPDAAARMLQRSVSAVLRL